MESTNVFDKLPALEVLPRDLKESLQTFLKTRLSSYQAFVGFDEFIDMIQKPVCKRANESITYFNTIAQWQSNYFLKASEKSILSARGQGKL
jgi:hypothetical protein